MRLDKVMRPAFISWYLCILFVLMFLLSSAVTYAPGARTLAAVMTISPALGALLFGGAAISFQRLERRPVPPGFLVSQKFRTTYVLIAAIITSILVLFVV